MAEHGHQNNASLTLSMHRLYTLHAFELSALLGRQAEAYSRYFTPFAYDYHTVRRQLEQAEQDIFTGVYVDSELAALWMLRGWDQGYDVPAFGLLVDERWAQAGIGALCLQAGIVTARLRGAERIMLKSHPENEHANALYRSFGFEATGVDGPLTVYHREL